MRRTWVEILLVIAGGLGAGVLGPVVRGQPGPAPGPRPRMAPPETKGLLPDPARPAAGEPAVSVAFTGPPAARLNQPLACRIVVRNTGAGPARDVVVRHRLGDGVVLQACAPEPGRAGDELTWTLDPLGPGETRTIELKLVARKKGPLPGQATVSFAAPASPVVVREPLVAVKLRAPARAVLGETAALVFAVSNPGDGPADGVKVRAILSEGLEYGKGQVADLDVGTLAPGESRDYQLPAVARASGVQKCQATVTGAGGLTATEVAQVEVLQPRLDLALAGPKVRYLDRHAVYTLKVTNPGSAPAAAVALKEVVPAGFKFHAASAGGHYQEATRTVSWVLGELPPGQSKEVTVELIPAVPGEHRLAAQVSTPGGLTTDAEARTQVEGLPALLIELADVDDPVEVGAETAYEIRVTNTGTRPETNLEVACTLPDQVELRGASCGADLRHRVQGRELVFEPLPKLAPKADVIYRVQVRGKAPGDVRFRARVRADGLPDPVLREESTRFYRDDVPLRPGPSAPPSSQ